MEEPGTSAAGEDKSRQRNREHLRNAVKDALKIYAYDPHSRKFTRSMEIKDEGSLRTQSVLLAALHIRLEWAEGKPALRVPPDLEKKIHLQHHEGNDYTLKMEPEVYMQLGKAWKVEKTDIRRKLPQELHETWDQLAANNGRSVG